MQIIEIEIRYAGGFRITDKATWNPDASAFHVSERLKQVIREMDVTEAPPIVSATVRGQTLSVEQAPDGDFRLKAGQVVPQPPEGFLAQLGEVIRRPTRDQRHQFARYAHTLSAGATIGAFGFWHSTTNWSPQNILSLANLCLASVVLFYIGIISMEGE